MMNYSLVSLILATTQRTEEVEIFLCKLLEQPYKAIEGIIMDQNSDDRLIPVINKIKDRVPIIHIISQPSLSTARNMPYITRKGRTLLLQMMIVGILQIYCRQLLTISQIIWIGMV